MSKKPTLYEILGVARTAVPQEIQLAYELKVQDLETQRGSLEHEDYDFRHKQLCLARDTLTDDVLRRGYDDKLAEAEAPPLAPTLQLVEYPEPQPNPEALSQRAEVLALRAEALALRADAMSIRGSGASSVYDTPSVAAQVASSWLSPFKKVLTGVGVAIVVIVAINLTLSYNAARRAQAMAAAAAAAAKAEEQLIIEEYFRKYGVRPASAAEARLLEQEQRRKEREALEEQRRRQQEEDATVRFQEEARREGERVSSNLHYSEERMKQEEAYQKMREEEQRRRQEAEDRMRIAEEQARMRRFLSK